MVLRGPALSKNPAGAGRRRRPSPPPEGGGAGAGTPPGDAGRRGDASRPVLGAVRICGFGGRPRKRPGGPGRASRASGRRIERAILRAAAGPGAARLAPAPVGRRRGGLRRICLTRKQAGCGWRGRAGSSSAGGPAPGPSAGPPSADPPGVPKPVVKHPTGRQHSAGQRFTVE